MRVVTRAAIVSTKAVAFIARHWLSLSIPVISLIYGLGDHRAWWDELRGRGALTRVLQRLESPDGFPTVFIYSNQPEFDRLEKFVSARTPNTEVRRRAALSQRPILITRAGGGERQIPGPPGWPRFITVPAESPVLYSYDATVPNQTGSDIQWAGTLRDVNGWIDEERDQERTVVNIFLISILSIALVVHENRTTSSQRAA